MTSTAMPQVAERTSGVKDGFKASLMTSTSDTVRTHLQRCRTLGEGLLKVMSPYIRY